MRWLYCMVAPCLSRGILVGDRQQYTPVRGVPNDETQCLSCGRADIGALLRELDGWRRRLAPNWAARIPRFACSNGRTQIRCLQRCGS